MGCGAWSKVLWASAVPGPPDPAPAHEGKKLLGKRLGRGPSHPEPGREDYYEGDGMLGWDGALARCLECTSAGGITKTDEKNRQGVMESRYRVWTGTELNDSTTGQVSWLKSELEPLAAYHEAQAKAAADAAAKEEEIASENAEREAIAAKEREHAEAHAQAVASRAIADSYALERGDAFAAAEEEEIAAARARARARASAAAEEEAKEEAIEAEQAQERAAEQERRDAIAKKASDAQLEAALQDKAEYEAKQKAYDDRLAERARRENADVLDDGVTFQGENPYEKPYVPVPDFLSCGLCFGDGGVQEALLYGCTDHRPDVVKDALANGADVNCATCSNDQGSLPLQQICHFWDQGDAGPEILEVLIEAGADVNSRDGGGRTPLYTAIHYKHFELALLLIDHDADINLCNSSDSDDADVTGSLNRLLADGPGAFA